MPVLLPVILPTEVRSLMHHALPLSMLLPRPALAGWYRERFVNLFAQIRRPHPNHPGAWLPGGHGYENEEQVWIDYTQPAHEYAAFLAQVPVRLSPDRLAHDLVEYLGDWLSDGRYATVYFDRYFVPGNPHFGKKHEISLYLIHGIDEVGNLKAVGLGTQNVFSEIDLTNSDVAAAIEGAHAMSSRGRLSEYHSDTLLSLIRVKDLLGPYPFSAARLVAHLEEYVEQRFDPATNYLMNAEWCVLNFEESPTSQGFHPGSAAFDAVEHAFHLLADDPYRRPISPGVINLFCDHKALLLDRLRVLEREYGLPASVMVPFKDVVKLAELLRLLFFKFSAAPNPSVANRLARVCAQAREVEKEVLAAVLNSLSDAVAPECSVTYAPAEAL